jgi:hypothetical protein
MVVGLLNFGAFVVGTLIVGGDAVNGDATCGRHTGQYYLFDKRLPNPCREVSKDVYLYSKIHSWSLFLSWPLVMAAGFYGWRKRNSQENRPLRINALPFVLTVTEGYSVEGGVESSGPGYEHWVLTFFGAYRFL